MMCQEFLLFSMKEMLSKRHTKSIYAFTDEVRSSLSLRKSRIFINYTFSSVLR